MSTPTNPHRFRPLKRYFSRQHSLKIRTNDLPLEKGARGVFTASGIFFVCVKLIVPLAYVYILLVLLRELSEGFPVGFGGTVKRYLPPLAAVISVMQKSSVFMEIWAVIEGLFFIILKLHIYWLQSKDPLEASLSAAPMFELNERRELWERIMKCEMEDPVVFLTGWFFDEKLENITKYDLLDFVAWSMFEGRNQEHLTHDELEQLKGFVDEIEWRISIHMYGFEIPSVPDYASGSEYEGYSSCDTEEYGMRSPVSDVPSVCSSTFSPTRKLSDLHWSPNVAERARPKCLFHFADSSLSDESTYFSNLYESYRQKYEDYCAALPHPVEGLRNFVAEKRQQIQTAEEHAMAAASQLYENAYYRAIDKGGNVDKTLTAFSHATQTQLLEAWNRMCIMKERLVLTTATSISNRRKALQQQLKGYNLLLARMRSMSYAVPSKQMAGIMRKITQCHEAIIDLEATAKETFVKASGFARESLFDSSGEPKRYAKYSSDPLLGLSTYPLAFHILILLLTDGGLRILMKLRGFERRKIGPVSYYYHPGKNSCDDTSSSGNEDEEEIPIVFCHGIGIGLCIYLPLIDGFLKTGRPILLPEIPYISGFRPWQSPYSILPPASVTSTLTAMLASHGFLRGVFIGHSYGTSWLSYMCKYAPSVTAAVMFLDPICFCLHCSTLTRHFVYHRSDPGSISYMIRTDVIINWTIQRSFPWTSISLFVEQLPENIPCSVFLSTEDALVPAERVERYLRTKGAPVCAFEDADDNHYATGPINVTVFSGEGHGDWVEAPGKMQRIAEAAEVLCSRVGKGNFKTE